MVKLMLTKSELKAIHCNNQLIKQSLVQLYYPEFEKLVELKMIRASYKQQVDKVVILFTDFGNNSYFRSLFIQFCEEFISRNNVEFNCYLRQSKTAMVI